MELSYLVRRISTPPSGEIGLDHPLWLQADPLAISHFHPKSSDHRPRTQARLLHDAANLFLRFDVDDRYVVSLATNYQDMVCFDSCVEFFFRPKSDLGYFNLEINCGGTVLWYYVEDPRPSAAGSMKYTAVGPEHGRRLTIYHSMPAIVSPERSEPARWSIACRIPLSSVEAYVGPLGESRNRHWDGNFYKCADHSSHPHWASWTPMPEKLNFHDPQHFRPIRFE